MKTLFPKQRQSVDFLKQSLQVNDAALDASSTGVGKTVIACRVAAEIGLPVAVVCPKIVIPSWEREMAEVGVKPIFILNYEKLRRGTQHLAKTGKKTFRWLLPKDTLIIWDEIHAAKNPWTLNAQMLIASKQAGIKNLMLSATACKSPTEMRAIGYALGLHSLNKSEGGKKSWFSWMLQYGCRQDPWKNWVPGPLSKLAALNAILYSNTCCKLTPADLPAAFADNHIITEPLEFASVKEISSFYEKHGVTPDIVEAVINGTAGSPHVLVQILRARQLAEAAKVADLIPMMEQAIDEGYSVAVFLNFVDTVKALNMYFPQAAVIVGGQSAQTREANVQAFQTNKTNIVLCNIAAGGVGVSLHDEHGGHPRMSFISPTFNMTEYIQTLGRIYRAGAKSPAIQRVLVASKTIEEKVLQSLETKRKELETLHN